MITYMSDIIVITNSSICKEDFLLRIEKLAKILNVMMILHAEHGQNCSTAVVQKEQ